MGETSDTGDRAADLGAELQMLLASHEVLLRSQDTLLGGYNALNSTINAPGARSTGARRAATARRLGNDWQGFMLRPPGCEATRGFKGSPVVCPCGNCESGGTGGLSARVDSGAGKLPLAPTLATLTDC